jgi:hypothetical protein
MACQEYRQIFFTIRFLGMQLSEKNKHLLVLSLLLIYLLSARQIYTRFFLERGKPVAQNAPLPVENMEMVYKLADLRTARVEGEELYELKGFAFLPATPLDHHRITIILRSETQTLAFPTEPAVFPSMMKSFKGYRPGMEQAEFRAFFSRHALPVGTYQVGILLEEAGGVRRAYQPTENIVRKTYNTVRYTPALTTP